MKNKVDLFRFTSVRGPQLINRIKRALGFVEFKIPTGSVFVDAVSDPNDIAQAQQQIGAVAANYSAFNTVEEVKAQAPDLWEFSIWLMKYKNELTEDLLAAQTLPNIPSGAIKIQFWDNVFYDLIARQNTRVRQACLQMLVAVNFLDKAKPSEALIKGLFDVDVDPATPEYEEYANRLLRVVGNAKVVIPLYFAKPSRVKQPTTTTTSNELPKTSENKRQMVNHKAMVSAHRVSRLETIKEELTTLEAQYRVDFETEQKTQYDAYVATVKPIIDAYIASQGGNIDPEDDEGYPDELVDTFRFEYPKPLSSDYTTGKISPFLEQYINDNKLSNSRINHSIQKVDIAIGKEKRKAEKMLTNRPKEVLIRGVKVKPSNTPACTAAISFESDNLLEKPAVLISIKVDNDCVFVDSASYSIAINRKTPLTSTKFELMNTKNGNILIKLTDPKISFQPGDLYEIQATVKLSNGTTLLLEKTGIVSGKGCPLKVTKTSHKSTISKTAEKGDVGKGDVGKGTIGGTVFGVDSETLYGVNKIGVVDFRKVEQELCCYVPGEVSHIENVMAREYKEKSVRSLVRGETTFESTTENETEELTENVTTGRHEISSEVSDIINKDRQISTGFNASASGGFGDAYNFSAGVNGNFAFGQSSSKSNATAKQYAEDVTRRALERVVHKTTVKRTSRMLREFEQNSKHGYDNREGTEHVTGVYRWVDKVYTNRLVNYGKRLLYEFIIPQPAKFYIDSVINAKDESVAPNPGDSTQDDDTPQGPIPPADRDPSIVTFSDVTRENYEELSAEYGVSIPPPPEATKIISTANSKSQAKRKQRYDYTFPDLMVPDGYYCDTLDLNAVCNGKVGTGKDAYINIAAAGENFEKKWTSGSFTNFQWPNSVDQLTLEGTINIAVAVFKFFSFTLSATATCYLKTSVYQTWQQEAYDMIMDAYNQQLQAFNDQANNPIDDIPSDTTIEEESTTAGNPGMNYDLIITELKRLSIELLTRQHGYPMGYNHYIGDGENCPAPIAIGPILDIHASIVKFFEQAFDWNLMAFMFYDYFWTTCEKWISPFEVNESVDHIFRAFLNSGMGRVVVPIREGFEDAVVYFMESGEIWNGNGMVYDTDDEMYLSIVDEMHHTEGVVEDEWETIVPTALTLIQTGSAIVKDEGLPCCEKRDEKDKEIVPYFEKLVAKPD